MVADENLERLSKMEISSLNYPAVGTICAALIAGLISFVVTVLAKDQKISEFRQAWIDALRSDAAELVSHLTISALVMRAGRLADEKGILLPEFESAGYKEFVAVKACVVRIRLRLNVKEHKSLLLALHEVDLADGGKVEHSDAVLNAVVVETQKVLKLEWRRVKKGEFSIRCVRWGGLIVFISVFVFSVYYVSPMFL